MVPALAGAHILYKKDQYAVAQEGRVVNASAASATITTNTATAEASPGQLAPYLPSGSEVVLQVRVAPTSIWARCASLPAGALVQDCLHSASTLCTNCGVKLPQGHHRLAAACETLPGPCLSHELAERHRAATRPTPCGCWAWSSPHAGQQLMPQPGWSDAKRAAPNRLAIISGLAHAATGRARADVA
jgi:hypothetical protein